MQIVHDMRTVKVEGPTILTIGNFDGLHRGHQALLATVMATARRQDHTRAGLMTFDPHPLAVLRPDFPHQILMSPTERMELAAALGMDLGVIQPFDHALSQLSAEEFLHLLVAQLGVAGLVVGPDFALGRNRAGTLPVLSELAGAMGLSLTVVAPVNWLDKPVRSSIIRQHLRDGDVAEAAALLGRAYSVTGRIVEGDKRGRQLGVPTANLAVDPVFLLPGDGVYATHVHVLDGPAAGAYAGATNIGVRPTVDGLHHRVETHLLDYTPVTHAEELYGAGMRLDFVARLRGEKRFGSLDELVAQIHQDIEQARALFAAEP
ncbi:MAG: bifunctional riboflavin kinase/FAD synthetase [Caldilineaceae bacterium]